MAVDFLERDDNYKKERELAEDVERLIDYIEKFIKVVNPVNNEVKTAEKAEIVPKRKNKVSTFFSKLSYDFFELLSEIKFKLKEKVDIVATQDCIEVRSDGLEVITENTFKKYLSGFNSLVFNYKLKTEMFKGENTYYHIRNNGSDVLMIDCLKSSKDGNVGTKTKICDEQCMHQIVIFGDIIEYSKLYSKESHIINVEIPNMNEVIVNIDEGHKDYIKCTSRLEKISTEDSKTKKEETKDIWHVIFERTDRKNNVKKLEMYYDSKEDYIKKKGPRIVKAFTREKEGDFSPKFEYILLDNGEYKGIGFENNGNEIKPISYQFTYNLEYVQKACEEEIRCLEAQKISRIGIKQGLNGFITEDILNVFDKIHPKYAERLKEENTIIESKKKEFSKKLNVQNYEMNLQPMTQKEFEEQINLGKTAYSKASKPNGKVELKIVKFKDYHDFYQFDDSIIADKTNGKNNTDTIICCGDSKFYRIASDDRSIVYEEYEKYNDTDLDFRHFFIREPLSDKYGGEYLKYKTQGFGKLTEYSFEEERKGDNESERKCNIEVHCTKNDNDKLPDKEKINERVYIQYNSKKNLILGKMPIIMIAQNGSTKEEFNIYGKKYAKSEYKYNKDKEEWESNDTWIRSFSFEEAKNICRLTAKNIDSRIVNINIIQGGIKYTIPDRVLEILKKIHPEVVIKLGDRKNVNSKYWESKYEIL